MVPLPEGKAVEPREAAILPQLPKKRRQMGKGKETCQAWKTRLVKNACANRCPFTSVMPSPQWKLRAPRGLPSGGENHAPLNEGRSFGG